ncbi:peroxisomal ATPase PEX6-like [Brevipalpus obovatus]|uniref:peroxisomal ATPase PEX6-like n=1 Tax=Brevipalpus obovatus TaxID=246614 RepID=UPI003D9F1487
MLFNDKVEWTARVLDHAVECEYDLENGVVFVSSCYYKSDVDWIKIKLRDNETYHVAKIVQLPQSLDPKDHQDSTVFLSPILFFNLLDTNKKCSFGVKDEVSVQIFIESEPKLADEVHLSVVNSPDYSCSIEMFQAYENLVKDYFLKERVIKSGDVLCIPSHLTNDYYRYNEDHSSINWPVINFLVRKPSDHGNVYRVCSETPKTVFASSSCALPSNARNFFDTKPLPPKLESYFSQLSECISPYFGNLQRKVGTVLLSGPSGCGKLHTCRKVAGELSVNLFLIECHELLAETALATAKALKTQLLKSVSFAPCIVYLRQIDLLCLDREDNFLARGFLDCLAAVRSRRDSSTGFVIVGSTSKPKMFLESNLVQLFFHHVNLEPPNEEERAVLLNYLCNSPNLDELVKTVAISTSGYSMDDLSSLFIDVVRDTSSDLLNLETKNFIEKVKKANQLYARSFGAPMISDVQWSDIGGLEEAKKEIFDCVQRPDDYPQLRESTLRRCGFLLYGPPGTGKTLLAKAVASQCSSNFLSVKGPELISAYVGQSEENIRSIFQKAVEARPCVIFFDELDSLAPKRGKFGDSAGVMDRIVSQMACEMDLISRFDNIFVFGATNRPDLLDPALLRPGRFDRWVYVGPPKSKEDRVGVLKALTRKFKLDGALDLYSVEDRSPLNLTGADFYSICSSAMLFALERCIKIIEENGIDESEAEIVVSFGDFERSLAQFVPSVKPEEFQKYEAIRNHMLRT